MNGKLPIRFAKCYQVNGPKIFEKIWSILTKFLSQKMVSRFEITSDIEKISLPYLGGQEYLPDFLGGEKTVEHFEFDLEEQIRKAFPRWKQS